MKLHSTRIPILLPALAAFSGLSFGQTAFTILHHPVIPVTRPILLPRPESARVEVVKVEAAIRMVDQIAVTTLDIYLRNPLARPLESVLVLPVPDGSVLGKFTFEGSKAEASAKLLPRDEARRLYDSIVAQTRDPALLEFVGTGLIQSSVFPVPANGTQRVQVTWEQLLTADGDRIDYVLPRSESLDYRVPWTFSVEATSSGSGIASLYSPSHQLDAKRESSNRLTSRVKDSSVPGPFQLSILRSRGDRPAASLVAYPDPKIGGGYFMLLAAPPTGAEQKTALKREVTVVIDRSGSMRGEKLEQVREATLQVLEGLADGEAFNLIIYNEAVELFSPQPLIKNAESMQRARDYVKNLRVSGGTNIHDALVEALRQKPTAGDFLPIVLFLTDGLPTIGQTAEKAIREAAEKGNPHRRRIFTFGVGLDVNTPLLNRLARDSRAVATFVLPKEDVEVKVGGVFRRLSGPVLAEPRMKTDPGRLTELLPSSLPDLFEGEQMVLLGQYRGESPIKMELTGRDAAGPRAFQFEFKLDHATTKNAHVSRLWASNKIGVLSEAIRDALADQNPFAGTPPHTSNDPRVRELVDEIVRLSREFGILTEYTAFFAEEGTDFTRAGDVLSMATHNYMGRSLLRSGLESYNQDINSKAQIEAKQLNRTNQFWDARMNSVEIANIQQINDKAFYKRGGQWVDSQLVNQPAAPDRIVEIGSAAFSKLVDQLASEGRQGCLSLRGEILIQVGGQKVLVR